MMSAPQAKKLKISGAEKPKHPIIFNTPGYPLDVRLQVFDQDFHLSSVPLKLHSAFFRKFFDSPDKVSSTGNVLSALVGSNTNSRIGGSLKFAYDWVTVLDGENDEGWHLCDIQKVERADVSKYCGDQKEQTAAFYILLSAIYQKSYLIANIAQLCTLTALADYYLALPVVSRSLNAALYKSDDFLYDLDQTCCEAVIAATKLRNKLLFVECVHYLIGPWHDPSYHRLATSRLKKSIHRVWLEVAATVAAAFTALTEDMLEEKELKLDHGLMVPFLDGLAARNRCISGYLSVPLQFKDIKSTAYGGQRCYDYLESLLVNNLVLTQSIHAEDPEKLQHHFLCANLDDEDLPWDVNEDNF